MKIRTQADIEELEQVPVAERIRHTSVADLLREATREHADRVAIRYLSGTGPDDPVRDVTYSELMQRVIQTANLLHAHGIGPDDTVTLLMPSVPETFFALWGAQVAAVANPVNYFLEASQIAAIMKQAGARGADRGRPLDLPRHLAEGRSDPVGDARAESVPHRRRTSHRRRHRLRAGLRSPARPTGSWRRSRSAATPWRRCSIPAERRACPSSPGTPTARSP